MSASEPKNAATSLPPLTVASCNQAARNMFDKAVLDGQREAEASTVLEAWVHNWPDVRDWRFEASALSTGMIRIRTYWTADGKIWMGEDHFSVIELQEVRDLQGMIRHKAIQRYNSFSDAAVVATSPAA